VLVLIGRVIAGKGVSIVAIEVITGVWVLTNGQTRPRFENGLQYIRQMFPASLHSYGGGPDACAQDLQRESLTETNNMNLKVRYPAMNSSTGDWSRGGYESSILPIIIDR